MATQRRIRAADVAAAAGVSQTTVSLVLNDQPGHVSEATRRRVLDVAAELGYQGNAAARQLASGVTRTIGLLLPVSRGALDDRILGPAITGLAATAHAAGYRVVVEPGSLDLRAAQALARARQVDALVLAQPQGDLVQRLAFDGWPVVVLGSRPDAAVPSVGIDEEGGARLAVEHLLALGHRRIACVFDDLAAPGTAERLAGYQAGLKAAGIWPDARLTVTTGQRTPNARSTMRQLVERETFSAVFATTDVAAAAVMALLRDVGRSVPGDVAVAGFDDLPLGEFLDPPLTTMRIPALELGEALGRAVLSRLGGDERPLRTVVPVQLVVRGSSAPAGTADVPLRLRATIEPRRARGR